MFGRILFINLTERTYKVREIGREIYRHVLGGKGLATYLLLEENPSGIDPLSPQNKLVIALGPVQDTPIWGSSRYGVFTKSPLTGLYAESYSGGRVAESMSKTGYDAFVLEGSSTFPVFLEISDKEVIFRDAKDIWSYDTFKSEDEIRRRIERKDAGVIVIGPAGENLVKFASIVNNYWRCAGRTGTGCVLGSKKVKGLAFYGSKRRPVAYPEEVKELSKRWLKEGKNMPFVRAFKTFGTPGLVSIINSVGAFPSYYWHTGELDGWESISAEALHMNFNVRARACSKCFIACGRYTQVTDGKYAGLKIEGPEYETIYAFGGLCGIKSLEDIIFLNDICDRLGMDSISAGNLVGLTIEASRMGKIKEKIDYGETEKIAELLIKIAKREGIGEILAEGVKFAAKEWNLEDIAIHVKGLEPGGYDPRYFKGMALTYATSDRGACHMRSTVFRAELSGIISPHDIDKKAEVMIDFEDRHILKDSLIVCRFYRDIYMWDEISEIIKATFGESFGKEDLKKVASSIRDMVRLFNLREGMGDGEDTLPTRFFTEPIGKGEYVLKRDDFERMLKDYYRIRGWDERGRPTRIPPFLRRSY
ncbi:MAG: aldehyde ferredoxin oxidoreductase family protein [Desulfobacterota bacterium]|nr:aldehyde ferredoxin oxidoreductase family protein [Thermodesulfobacteriota bacterium]MDW8002269.1 aldehyde ferredoxin oxidoreductase family protein [Deltaproteobacteria bacterium]